MRNRRKTAPGTFGGRVLTELAKGTEGHGGGEEAEMVPGTFWGARGLNLFKYTVFAA